MSRCLMAIESYFQHTNGLIDLEYTVDILAIETFGWRNCRENSNKHGVQWVRNGSYVRIHKKLYVQSCLEKKFGVAIFLNRVRSIQKEVLKRYCNYYLKS